MKKILFILTLFMIMPFNSYAKSDVITIYMFESNTCSHCADALEYLENHVEDIPEGVEIVAFELSKEDNATLMDEVADYLEVDKTKDYGTPFFVVGSEYNKGYVPGDWEELFSIAKNYLENKDEYEDVVLQVADKQNLKVETESIDELINIPNPVVTTIVYAVFGVIVLGFVALMVFSRK